MATAIRAAMQVRHNLHSTVVSYRALYSGVGLGESTSGWGTYAWVTAGPGTNTIKLKTYYTYDIMITHSVPKLKADIDSAFRDREQKQSIRAWRWHTAAEILRGKRWRQEDRGYVAKQHR